MANKPRPTGRAGHSTLLDDPFGEDPKGATATEQPKEGERFMTSSTENPAPIPPVEPIDSEIGKVEPGHEPSILEDRGVTDTHPQSNPTVRVPLDAIDEDAASKVDLALRSTTGPMAKSVVAAARVGLSDLSVEEQLELAISAHETVGKASGYIPDFHALTENMKGAMLKVVRDVWIAAQRKARTFNE